MKLKFDFAIFSVVMSTILLALTILLFFMTISVRAEHMDAADVIQMWEDAGGLNARFVEDAFDSTTRAEIGEPEEGYFYPYPTYRLYFVVKGTNYPDKIRGIFQDAVLLYFSVMPVEVWSDTYGEYRNKFDVVADIDRAIYPEVLELLRFVNEFYSFGIVETINDVRIEQ